MSAPRYDYTQPGLCLGITTRTVWFMAATAQIQRTSTVTVSFDRIGPAPARRPRTAPVYPSLTVRVPEHTARHNGATAAYLRELVHRHVLMFMPADVRRYEVDVQVTGPGQGTVTITELLAGAQRYRSTPRDLGTATIAPTDTHR